MITFLRQANGHESKPGSPSATHFDGQLSDLHAKKDGYAYDTPSRSVIFGNHFGIVPTVRCTHGFYVIVPGRLCFRFLTETIDTEISECVFAVGPDGMKRRHRYPYDIARLDGELILLVADCQHARPADDVEYLLVFVMLVIWRRMIGFNHYDEHFGIPRLGPVDNQIVDMRWEAISLQFLRSKNKLMGFFYVAVL